MHVALFGESSSGKDYIADILDNLYGYTRYAFDDDVASLAKIYFPYRYEDKELLQDIEGKMREIDPEVWIKSMFQSIDDKASDYEAFGYAREITVITDCRLPNEYEALKDRGYTFIKVTADSVVRYQRMIERGDTFTEDNLKHDTESYYGEFEFGYEIANNGTREDVIKQLDSIIKDMSRKS